MSGAIAITIGSVLALGATITAYFLIIPDAKRPGLHKFWQWIHDTFTFKSLLLEHILRALYIFYTLACIGSGFFMLFAGKSYWGEFRSFAGYGLLLMVVGPILVRITFESFMLIILICKKIMNIDNKMNILVPAPPQVAQPASTPFGTKQPPAPLSPQPDPFGSAQPPVSPASQPAPFVPEQPPVPPAPAYTPPPVEPPKTIYCTKCGTAYTEGQSCPNGCQ